MNICPCCKTSHDSTAWIPSSEITNRPDLHSTALETVKLLIAVRDIPTAQFGKYIATCDEWVMDGSPSRWEITHFAVIPFPPNADVLAQPRETSTETNDV